MEYITLYIILSLRQVATIYNNEILFNESAEVNECSKFLLNEYNRRKNTNHLITPFQCITSEKMAHYYYKQGLTRFSHEDGVLLVKLDVPEKEILYYDSFLCEIGPEMGHILTSEYTDYLVSTKQAEYSVFMKIMERVSKVGCKDHVLENWKQIFNVTRNTDPKSREALVPYIKEDWIV